MTTHSEILAEFERQYESRQDAVLVGPSSLAFGTWQAFATGNEDTRIRYLSLEQLKAMARRFLARRHDADSDENPSHSEQSSFEFSGQLQPRYPLPRTGDEEPAYKLRSCLTPEERAWNVEQLRKSARSRLEHADALEAEGLSAGAA